MLWYLLFFAIALKIPTLWLCWVVWWAIKSKPDHETGGASGGYRPPEPDQGGPWWKPGGRTARLAHRRGPHGAPTRRPGQRAPTYAERSDVAETR